jgi:hypothetical protein
VGRPLLSTACHGSQRSDPQVHDGDTFKVNGQCLKLFLEPNPLDFEEVDVLNFLELE